MESTLAIQEDRLLNAVHDLAVAKRQLDLLRRMIEISSLSSSGALSQDQLIESELDVLCFQSKQLSENVEDFYVFASNDYRL